MIEWEIGLEWLAVDLYENEQAFVHSDLEFHNYLFTYFCKIKNLQFLLEVSF